MNLRKTSFAGVAILFCSLFTGLNNSYAEENTGVTSTTVTFAATFPLTGAASPGISSYYLGVNAYFDHINANGGIYGRKLVFLNLDNMGIPGTAINKTTELLSSFDSFAFISNAPSCSNQLAVKSSVSPARRGVPNLFVDCYLESVEDSSEYVSTNYYSKLSSKNEIKILKSYIDRTLPNQRIALAYQDDDNGIQISKLANDSKVVCKKNFPAGAESFLSGCNSTVSPLRDGDVVIYAGSPAGLARLIMSYSVNLKLNLKYFVNYDAYNLKVFQLAGLPMTNSTEIYTVSHNSLISETSNNSVSTLSEIGQRYSLGTAVDQRFLNGMNAAYIVANVLGSVGPDLTRERFMKAMDLFGSQFDVLGVSARSQDLSDRFIPTGGVIVRNIGATSESISEVFSIVQNQISIGSRKSIQISNKGLPVLIQLLPKPTPTPTPTVKPTSTPTPSPTLTVKPTPTPEPIVEIDGEDEEPFGKITVKKEKTKYTISVLSNLPNEALQVRATKKGQKAIIYKVTTNDDGAAKFSTTRALAGYQLVLLLDGEILSSVKAG
ncbi:MAG: ABC transporter substrate-binding protein [Actinobacteria bacterium]|nr:ABC transporter substrate-binding protein [Actinomycetota bacterium]